MLWRDLGEAMRQRDKKGGKVAQTRRSKRRDVPKIARGRSSVVPTKETNAQLRLERDEALEQLTASSEVLRIISNSPGELEPVFKAMLAHATRLCEADYGVLSLNENGVFRVAATHAVPQAYIEYWGREREFKANARSAAGRVAATKKLLHIADFTQEETYKQRDPAAVALGDLGGARTVVLAPMLKEGALIGIFFIYRQEVRPFSEKQIKLVENFATQAVIAIENARLLNELRQSLQQQTATADVLKTISRSTFDLKSVLNTLVQSAAQLCEADLVSVPRVTGGIFDHIASYGYSPDFHEFMRSHPTLPGRATASGRAVAERKTVHIPDVLADPEYDYAGGQKLGGFRTLLGVPLLREGAAIGALVLGRSAPRPFTPQQIELAETFADQAVIAIENVRLFEAEQHRTRELSEALEQQTATSEVLKIVSSSPGELEPVFGSILANTTNLCGARFATLSFYDGEKFTTKALHNPPPGFQGRLGESWRPHPKSGLARVAATKEVVQIDDLRTQPPYLEGDRAVVTLSDVAGARTLLIVPMVKDDALVGSISIYRQEVQPFSDKQVALVANFAAQAVIAIENTRLLSELRESLQQQTATAEVLKVISSSPGELGPVFQAMLENATRICEAKFGTLYRYDGTAFYRAAGSGTPAALNEIQKKAGFFLPEPGTLLYRVLQTRKAVHSTDYQAEPALGLSAKFGGARSTVAVPMLKDDELIGAIVIYRQEIRPFADNQIELLTNFAAQAVIAIENARLLNELRESLEQQTGTAEVLRVISSSPGELQPVFDTMLAKATELCDASYGAMWLRDDDGFRNAAFHGELPSEYIEQWRDGALIRPGPDVPMMRVVHTRQPVQMADLRDSPAYRDREPIVVTAVDAAGIRTLVSVPMFKAGEVIGTITIYRKEVRPFTDKQVALVANFASQAVIAIENARLLSELRESLQQQTATADVLKVISRSAFDLQTVLDTLVASAARLCDANQAYLFRRKGEDYIWAASHGFSQEAVEFRKNRPLMIDRGTAMGRAIVEGKFVHIPDVLVDTEYANWDAQKISGYRSLLGVPLLREGIPMGVFSLTRLEPRPFTDKQIELLTTFADQAAIAIENVRLFESVEARTRELAKSLQDLRTAQDRLVQTEKLASLGQLTAGIAHEIKNPLNFVNNFSAVSVELIDELRQALAGANLDDKLRAQISEIADMLQGNLDKVVQHGKRADSIVKNMLLHSRQGSAEHRPVDINAVVEESLNLAYHGARAEKQGFNITLERSLDPAAGEVDVFPQDITRVLLNLISNGFYAATKRKAEADGDNYEPTVAAITKNLGHSVEIRIRDNGTGIPPDVKEKMFNPFFTTKPAGEGTGLGLSISHDIIVKQHGGSIDVDTQPGEFTEFRIVLPRGAAAIAKSGERP
jgi:GAF domain-containing protein